MNRFGIGVVVILVIAVGVFLFMSQQEGPPEPTEQPTAETPGTESPEETGQPSEAAGETETPTETEQPSEPAEESETAQTGEPEEEPAATSETEPGEAPSQSALTVDRLRQWPANGFVTTQGLAVFQALVANGTDAAVSEELTLAIDGRSWGEPRSVQLEPGASATVIFSARGFEGLEAGEHNVSLGGQSATLTLVQPATSPERPGEIPPNPKVLSAESGLTEPGIPGGKLVSSGLNGPKTLNALVAQETSSTNLTTLMGAGLVEVNPSTFEIEPALATHWETSADRTELTFHLRRGVKFSDGEPFTADDVMFTYNDLIFNDDVITDSRDVLMVAGEPVQFEKVDDYTVKVITPEPFRPLLRVLTGYIYPKHKLADQVAKLNPGVRGTARGVKGALDNHRDALAELAPDLVGAADAAFERMNAAAEAQSVEDVNAAAEAIRGAYDALVALLDDEDEAQVGIKSDLEGALSALEPIGDHAEAGQWEGVAPGNFNQTWTADVPASAFAGLGPYRFVRYDVDQQVILERNPYFWKVDENGVQLPYLDQLVSLVVENSDVAFLKFRTGETDTYGARAEDWPSLMEGVSQQDCRQVEKGQVCTNEAEGWELMRGGPTFGTTFVTLNQDASDLALRAVFRDARFRQAVAHTFDKGSMIENVLNGLGVPQWSPVSEPSPFYDEEAVAAFPYDLERARAILDDLHLVDTDGDDTRNITDRFLSDAGVELESLPEERRAEDDRELSINYVTASGSTTFEKLSNLIVSDWKQVGFEVNFRPVDFNSLVTDLLGGNYEAVMISFTGGVEPSNGKNIWKSDGGLHFWRYSAKDTPPEWEKRVDELFDLADVTFDTAQVQEYFSEFQRLVSENLPLIYTVNNQFIYASRASWGNNDHFQAITGNAPTSYAFSEMLWWKDEARRAEVEEVEPQG